MHLRKMCVLVGGVLALFAPVACGDDGEPVEVERELSVAVPDGYEFYDGSDHGFLIALPSTWESSSLSDDDIKALYREAQPEMVELLQNDPSELALIVRDPSGFPNLNVRTSPRPPGAVPQEWFGELEAGMTTQISSLGGTVVSAKRVDRGGYEGLLLVSETTFPVGLAELHQYFILSEDAGFIITLTSVNPAVDREIFADVMETFTPVGD